MLGEELRRNLQWNQVLLSQMYNAPKGAPREFAVLRALKKDHPGHMLVFTDVGLHDNLKTKTILMYMKKLLEETKTLGDTDILFMTPYIPGLQKSPSFTGQTEKRTIEFANFFRRFSKNMNISFLDPTELVRPLVSVDGTHYTNGLNEAIVDIISNYILKAS
ncbi:unnamed protein product [Owenia fusiformis]|uniref:Uncharacterized protein n=1 Tax=Owenia fusiformis TaxID=6347 RepID=A0A8J1TNC0_OWEFU|nr:unnamed protein product [Owenia fusiformis]